MTRTQYRRMCVFALRMVRVSCGDDVPEQELRDHVREVLCMLADNSWSCHWSHIEDWDNNTRLPDDDGTAGFALRDCRYLLSDFLHVYCWERGLCTPPFEDDAMVDEEESPLGNALCCIIRAAVDVAAEPSAGVIGWTVGDLRQMWAPRPLPRWLAEYFTDPLDGVADDVEVWL